jgi:hypothetical protein
MQLPYPSRPETVHAAQVFGSVQNQRNAGEALLFHEYLTAINNPGLLQMLVLDQSFVEGYIEVIEHRKINLIAIGDLY